MPLLSTRGANSAKGFGLTGGRKKTAAFTANLLVVAGGGGAGAYPSGGGGGAGGLILYPAYPFGEGPQSYPITIGGGGAGGTNIPSPATTDGKVGSDTVFVIGPVTFTGKGGGGTATAAATGGTTAGGSGGGGGGEGGPTTAGTSTQAPSMPAPLAPFGFGFPGGDGTSSPRTGGGGGGAGSIGGDSNNGPGGAGGSGKDVTPLFGAAPQPYYLADVPNTGATSTGYFAGGGGGAGENTGPTTRRAGGIGGGGSGGSPVQPLNDNLGAPGAVNSGGGGGFSRDQSPGGVGGSGVVMLKVPSTAAPGISVTPGTNSVIPTPDGAVIRFTVSGNFNY